MTPTATCKLCGRQPEVFSPRLGYCADCIRSHFDQVWPEIEAYHHQSRQAFGLPLRPPQDPEGKVCTLCFHACRIPEGGVGFCGARRVSGGRLKGGNPAGAGVSFYYDPLPTNCVADWFCPGGTGRGYPKYAYAAGPERGYVNLAVFYHACNFNCLFCQNWTFKRRTFAGDRLSAAELAQAAHARTACICYFGGDPTPQLPHALATSRLALEAARQAGRKLRICWETNGAMQGLQRGDSPGLVRGVQQPDPEKLRPTGGPCPGAAGGAGAHRQHPDGAGICGFGGNPRPGPVHRHPESRDSLQPPGFLPAILSVRPAGHLPGLCPGGPPGGSGGGGQTRQYRQPASAAVKPSRAEWPEVKNSEWRLSSLVCGGLSPLQKPASSGRIPAYPSPCSASSQ
ncbi:MAG: radical SAM protein [Deltaproteobacteria bacterium]|nr:radical SAM protein [Deltaproteobacteria bacterium]